MKTLALSNNRSGAGLNHKQTATGTFSILRNGAVALAVGASLVLGSLGFATGAAAAPVDKASNAQLCSDLRLLYVSNMGIANDPKTSEADRIEAKQSAARAKADFDKYCGTKAARAGALATSLDLVVVEDMAPATDGELAAPVGPASLDRLSPLGTRLVAR